jgi:hypothetical protein
VKNGTVIASVGLKNTAWFSRITSRFITAESEALKRVNQMDGIVVFLLGFVLGGGAYSLWEAVRKKLRGKKRLPDPLTLRILQER